MSIAPYTVKDVINLNASPLLGWDRRLGVCIGLQRSEKQPFQRSGEVWRATVPCC